MANRTRSLRTAASHEFHYSCLLDNIPLQDITKITYSYRVDLRTRQVSFNPNALRPLRENESLKRWHQTSHERLMMVLARYLNFPGPELLLAVFYFHLTLKYNKNIMLQKAKGQLRYTQRSALAIETGAPDDWWLVVDFDQGLIDFYYSMLPKAWYATRGRYDAHITVSRNEEPPNKEAWGRHEGKVIEFSYVPGVRYSETYIWLDIYCHRLEEVRQELGYLVDTPICYPQPIEGFRWRFHTTIANLKPQL